MWILDGRWWPRGATREFLRFATGDAVIADDLKDLLRLLYNAGAENVPASETGWRQDQMPILMRALDMGYVGYRERAGTKHFSLTKAGYSAIGIEPLSYSPLAILGGWFRRLFG
jgi:hypothetical protein